MSGCIKFLIFLSDTNYSILGGTVYVWALWKAYAKKAKYLSLLFLGPAMLLVLIAHGLGILVDRLTVCSAEKLNEAHQKRAKYGITVITTVNRYGEEINRRTEDPGSGDAVEACFGGFLGVVFGLASLALGLVAGILALLSFAWYYGKMKLDQAFTIPGDSGFASLYEFAAMDFNSAVVGTYNVGEKIQGKQLNEDWVMTKNGYVVTAIEGVKTLICIDDLLGEPDVYLKDQEEKLASMMQSPTSAGAPMDDSTIADAV